MVLELGQKDRPARGEEVPAVGVGHEVERLGGVLREQDLRVGPRRPDEPSHGSPCHLELPGGLLRDGVDATVHVRVGGLVVVVHRVEHGARPLGRRGRVEIDEPFAVRLLLEQRELLAEGGDVEGVGCDGSGHARSSS